MRSRIIAAVLLAAVLVTGLGGALASPGTVGDPFVTLSYLTGTFYPELEQAMLEQAQKGTAQIEKNALDKLAALSGSYLEQAGRDRSYSDGFLRLTLARNESLTLYSGSSVQFDAGQVSLALSSGCLVDATTGTTVDGTGTGTHVGVGMAPSQDISACIQCGGCEERCPFSVPVRERMEKAAALFGE